MNGSFKELLFYESFHYYYTILTMSMMYFIFKCNLLSLIYDKYPVLYLPHWECYHKNNDGAIEGGDNDVDYQGKVAPFLMCHVKFMILLLDV